MRNVLTLGPLLLSWGLACLACCACSAPGPSPVPLSPDSPVRPMATTEATEAPAVSASAEAVVTRPIGPYEIPFDGARNVYFAVPPTRPSSDSPRRLIANLHGLCNPPGYACGYWTH